MIEYITPSIFDQSLIKANFTLKSTGYKNPISKIQGLNLGDNKLDNFLAIRQNRKEFYHYFNMDENWAAWCKQVHSSKVIEVTNGGVYDECDGLLTQIPNLSINIQVADCGSVLLADEKNKIIAAVHAGWRGASGGILENALNQMIANGANSSDIKAYIGPCISKEYFEVGEEVAELFPEFVVERTKKKPHIDLKGYLISILKEKGVLETNIETSNLCTIKDNQNLYSHRKEADKAGRMVASIQLL